MLINALARFASGLILFLMVPGVFLQNDCSYYEEGTSPTLTCRLPANEMFNSFGPRIEVDGQLVNAGSCDRNGACSTDDASRFRPSFFINSTSNTANAGVTVDKITRKDTRLTCYKDGVPIPGAWCNIKVYVKASPPQCEGPRFVGDNTTAVTTCTTQRIYPGGKCDYRIRNLGEEDFQFLSLSASETDSRQYPGDKEFMCQLLIHITGMPEKTYHVRPEITPNLPGLPASAVATTPTYLPALTISPTALYSSSDNNHDVEYSASDEIEVNIRVTGNPPPNHFSLSKRDDETSPPVPLSEQDFSVTYSASSSDAEGTITLVITGGLDRGTTSFYTLKADNGVVGTEEFRYNFVVRREYTTPSKPVCDGPRFVDGGAAFVINCTSERVYPEGRCSLRNVSGPPLDQKPETIYANVASTKFPDDKKLTCQMRVPVREKTEGTYTFQVAVTLNGITSSPPITTEGYILPAVNLKPTALYDPTENNHEYDYPSSGVLALDIHVLGNPEPNRVQLRAGQGDGSAMVSLSSQDYQWEYDKTAGAVGGIIKLSITGGLREDVSTMYVLKAENGVSSTDEFEYKFSVRRAAVQPTADPQDQSGEEDEDSEEGGSSTNVPLIVGIIVAAVVVIAILVIALLIVLRRGRDPSEATPDSNFDPPYSSFDQPGPSFTNPDNGIYAELGATGENPPAYDTLREKSGVYSMPEDP
ncbi:hypothetical protein PoB_005548700 [Plakobranchus ocellatus]|uniref:CUB domain-containing protein n=1 Tax=Plakobranchus ocellatus TaxID=259542 RepID=A0AAV4CCR7_9GAST|nr:hypothetical protein PoB_005548700 [Plakobranchus ocellatus]